MSNAARIAIALTLTSVLLSGCSPAREAYKRAESEAELHQWDRAVMAYSKAVSLAPDNTEYSIALSRARFRASQEHFQLGKKYLAQGQLDLAIGELQATTMLDPSNQYATDELAAAVRKWQEDRLSEDQKTDLEKLKEKMSIIGTAPPKLDPASNLPIFLKFEDQEIGKIYDALSRVTGINFFYDDKLDLTKKVSIDVARVPFEKAMDILMLQNKHFYKVLDDNSIIIADDTRQKRQEYEDEVIQTFFLSNADVKDVQTILRTLLDARKIAQNTQLNSITIRDTPEKVAIAARIIEMNDKTKAELVIDVELLQINRTTLTTLGIDLTAKTFGINFTGSDGGIPLNNLKLLENRGSWVLSPIPGFVLNFLKSDSDTRVVARPQLRVSEGEKANLHIGDRIPIPTTTFNTATTVGTNVVPITSFTYQEVGIIIEIEPRVHHNKEVTLKILIEVSDVTGDVQAGGGVSQPIIGSREISTVIRLKDGETNLLAGLISEATRSSLSGVPGLSDIPILKRLFGSTEEEVRQIDIVLTLTPHIIRTPDIRERDLRALWIGREGNLKLKGSEGSAFGSPFVGEEGEATLRAESPIRPVAEFLGSADLLPATLRDVDLPGIGFDEAPGPQEVPEGAAAIEPEAEPEPEPVAAEPVTPPAVADDAAEPTSAADDTQPAPSEAEPPPPPAPAGPLELALAPPLLVARAGSDFNLVLNVSGANDLGRIIFTLEWDEALLIYRSVSAGNLFSRTGKLPSFQFQKLGNNRVRVDTSLRGGEGATGVGPIALVRFRASAVGASELKILDVEAFDAAGNPVTVSARGGKVLVQ